MKSYLARNTVKGTKMDELVGYLKSQTSGRIVTGDETANLA